MPQAQFDSRLSVLETEVKGIVGTQQSIINAVDRISNKIDQKSTPQWSVYISAIGVLLTVLVLIGTAWKAPIETQLSRHESDLRLFQSHIVPRNEHEEHWRQQERDFSFMRDRISREEDRSTKGEDRLEKRIDRLEAKQLR
ncbi:hypothetical protein [uncultured Methylobacterium sp.]|uniref:hypothetical protein n=1 Tax=uncultured Methylobacterium sp. TaxID=157278 RepID=UPI002602F813|nr:hypothetical protein [uncultured Methylobacterium sp.]